MPLSLLAFPSAVSKARKQYSQAVGGMMVEPVNRDDITAGQHWDDKFHCRSTCSIHADYFVQLVQNLNNQWKDAIISLISAFLYVHQTSHLYIYTKCSTGIGQRREAAQWKWFLPSLCSFWQRDPCPVTWITNCYCSLQSLQKSYRLWTFYKKLKCKSQWDLKWFIS